MKTNGNDRTAIGAILVGTVGALALSMLFFARAPNPHVRVIEMETHPDAEAWKLRLDNMWVYRSKPAPVIMVSVGRVGPVPEVAEWLTPYDVAPRMTNGPDVGRALTIEYPQPLRDAGIGGAVEVWFLINEDGVVHEAQLMRSSGHAQLDFVVRAATEIVEFKPAMKEGKNIPAWVSIPITFAVR